MPRFIHRRGAENAEMSAEDLNLPHQKAIYLTHLYPGDKILIELG
jgi:hypothetical protein